MKKSRQKVVVHPVRDMPLVSLKPNPWNPNELTPFEKQSLKWGFQKDGWVASHALTAWGKDDKGRERNLIIDGEHRWYTAKDLGMLVGPVCVIDGLTEAQAKALTVKLDAKRGKFEETKLKLVLRDIEPSLDLESRSLELGIGEDKLAQLLSTEEERMHVPGDLPSGKTSNVMTVQLFFDPKLREEFDKLAKELAVRYRTDTLADTVMRAMHQVRG